MAQKNQPVEEQHVEDVKTTLKDKPVGTWFERNRKKVIWIVSVILGLVLVGVGVYFFWYKPTIAKIDESNAKAKVYVDQANWKKALNGDGGDCVGFKAIADKYPRFQGGKLAAAGAGVCYYHLGQYAEAITYFEKFSADDADYNFGPAVSQMMGDAYVNLKQYDKALEKFNAVVATAHPVYAPMCLKKAGIVYLEKGNKAAAKRAFEAIKANYLDSYEALDIEKYIAAAQ